MRLLIIHNSGRSGVSSGELVVAKAEARSMRDVGVYVHLHIVNNDTLLSLFSIKTLLAGFNIFWSYSSFRAITELIEKHQPDIVHFHGVLPLLTPSAFYACKRKGIPVVQTLHNFRWICVEGGLYKNNTYCDMCVGNLGWRGVFSRCSRGSLLASFVLWLVNLFYRKSGLLYSWVDRFIVVSEFVKDKYLEAGFPDTKLQVKYNAAPNCQDALSASIVPERSGVTYVGRLTASKGTGTLLNIFRYCEFPINIIGTGPDLLDLKQYCRDYNLTHVKFWGQVSHSEVLKIISSSLCVVVPSVCGETFSLVAVESMACGTPVIASNIGGVVELITKSQAGVIVDSDNREAFVEAINEIAIHPERISLMRDAGIRYVQDELREELMTSKLISIYKELIDDNLGKELDD